MTLKHMKIFIAVYQEMNITSAAKRLHMTQPAVTRAIREMEKYYGVLLFERLNHRIHRTEVGDSLYAHAIHIMESFENLEKGLQNWEEMGMLRIGGSITVGNYIFPQIIPKFQEMYPKLRIQVKVSNSAQLQEALIDNKIDFALIEGKVLTEHLTVEHWKENRMKLIFPAVHPLNDVPDVHLRDLASYPLLLREEGSAGRAYLNQIFAFHEMSVKPMWESVSSQALIKAVEAGIGISVLPEELVQEAVESGRIHTRTISDESFVRNSYFVWHKQKCLTKSAKDFMKLCRT